MAPLPPNAPFVEPPAIFENGVLACAVDVERLSLDPGARPPHLAAARDVRVREHLAGRFCAAAALRGAGARSTAVGVDADGAPVWPAGFVGSITHTRTYACAAVAPVRRVRGLGIDSEPVLTDAALHDVTPLSFVEAERTWLREAEPRLTLATLVFSAKESLYKCLRPLAGVYFDFVDACVEGQPSEGRFCIQLLRSLPGFRRGLRLDGRYAVERGLVHTVVVLPADASVRRSGGDGSPTPSA